MPTTTTLVLDFPPSANTYTKHRVAVHRDGKSFVTTYTSQRGKDFKKSTRQVVKRVIAELPLTGRLAVHIMLHAPNNRRYDIDNRVKPLLDALQHAGLFLDDEQVDAIEVQRGPVQPNDGMALVVVDQLL